jgi:hypothetical protein
MNSPPVHKVEYKRGRGDKSEDNPIPHHVGDSSQQDEACWVEQTGHHRHKWTVVRAHKLQCCKNSFHRLLNYSANLHFLLAFIRAQVSLTNDEWDLVDCRHCKTHNEPKHCPWPEIWSSCRQHVPSYQDGQTCEKRWTPPKPKHVNFNFIPVCDICDTIRLIKLRERISVSKWAM